MFTGSLKVRLQSLHLPPKVSLCFAFWHAGYRLMRLNFPIVDLTDRLQLSRVNIFFFARSVFRFSGQVLDCFASGVFDHEFGQLLPVVSVQFRFFWHFRMCFYVLRQFCLCRFLGRWVVSLLFCFLFSWVHLF